MALCDALGALELIKAAIVRGPAFSSGLKNAAHWLPYADASVFHRAACGATIRRRVHDRAARPGLCLRL